MIVNEIFYSIDGEGIRAGALAVFVRLAGCNLRCSYCDTEYAHGNTCGEDMSIKEIINSIAQYNCKNITLTGGEPLLHSSEALELIDTLLYNGYIINIETNGSIDIRQYIKNNVIITMDYKCPSSGCEGLMKLDNLRLLRECDVLKFVVGNTEDLNRASEILHKYKVKSHVFFSPVYGEINPQEIVDFMKSLNFPNARIQIQLHKIIWNPNERGV